MKFLAELVAIQILFIFFSYRILICLVLKRYWYKLITPQG